MIATQVGTIIVIVIIVAILAIVAGGFAASRSRTGRRSGLCFRR